MIFAQRGSVRSRCTRSFLISMFSSSLPGFLRYNIQEKSTNSKVAFCRADKTLHAVILRPEELWPSIDNCSTHRNQIEIEKTAKPETRTWVSAQERLEMRAETRQACGRPRIDRGQAQQCKERDETRSTSDLQK